MNQASSGFALGLLSCDRASKYCQFCALLTAGMQKQIILTRSKEFYIANIPLIMKMRSMRGEDGQILEHHLQNREELLLRSGMLGFQKTPSRI